jgi:hypothetical protein
VTILRKSVVIDRKISRNSRTVIFETRQKTPTVIIDDIVYEIPEAKAAPDIPYLGINKISKMTVNRNEINAMAAL